MTGGYALQGTAQETVKVSDGSSSSSSWYLPLLPGISFAREALSARDYDEQGLALTKEEKYEEALAFYERALSFNRSLVDAWYYRGDALARLGRNREAILAFGNATTIDPDFVEASFYEGLVWGKLGLFREQEGALARGLDAADRRKAQVAATAAGAERPVPLPVSPGTALAGAWAAASLRAILLREKKG